MEKKKTTRTKKSEEGGMDIGWAGILLEGVFKSIQASFDGAFERAHRAIHTFTRRVTRQVFLFFFAFLGLIFLLVGLAQILSAAYRFPGSGEAIIGMFILLICLVIYTFDRGDN